MSRPLFIIAFLLLSVYSWGQQKWVEVNDTAIAYDFLTEDKERFFAITLDTKTIAIASDTFHLVQLLYTADEALITKIQSRNISKVRIERMREYATGCPEEPSNWERNSNSPFTGSLFGYYRCEDPRDFDYNGKCNWSTIELYRIVKVK